VVGLPGSEPYAEYLNAFALAGGVTTSYYVVADTAEFDQTLLTIARNAAGSCRFQLPAPPEDPALLNVLVDCQVIKGPDPADTDGGSLWTFDPTTLTITLEGGICDSIVNGDARRVDYVIGCGSCAC
jgi:hypothetical protein